MKSSAAKKSKSKKRDVHVEEALLVILDYLKAETMHWNPNVLRVEQTLREIVKGEK